MNISCSVLFYIKSNIFLNNFFFMTVPEEPDLNKLSRLLKRKMIWRYFTDLILVGNILDFKIRADLSNLGGNFSVKHKLFFNKNGKTINMWFCDDAFFFDFMQMSPIIKRTSFKLVEIWDQFAHFNYPAIYYVTKCQF